ncbi:MULTISPECIES: DUF2975 domain-containing protein [unclassified Novosphingobium]|jgi:hypothetical protein|uniref:DUF2975 domain-containing protein n=1 Tax=unclassified Novosphingobium TaxID=2644732 RepID=UPI00020EE7AC|nr:MULTISPECIES: DUF2975 domain-containing protein [unclassified Novosphingobium]GFM28190.1 putative uncharacterized protein [Novosphingobium sp. PY1]CCA91354.1 conserved hypothetical protein [Novosphingobium sp. PP1Y]
MNAITRLANDPLLSIAKGILYFLMVAMGVGAAGCLAGMIGLFAFPGQISVELGKDAPGFDFVQFRWLLELVLALAIALLAMLGMILLHLKRIVDTVGQGDPFVPDNATRLTRMAWLSLAVQLVSLPISGLGTWIHKVTEGVGADKGDFQIDGGVDGNGLLLMLILFILARVFRKGAEMRAELEGTV